MKASACASTRVPSTKKLSSTLQRVVFGAVVLVRVCLLIDKAAGKVLGLVAFGRLLTTSGMQIAAFLERVDIFSASVKGVPTRCRKLSLAQAVERNSARHCIGALSPSGGLDEAGRMCEKDLTLRHRGRRDRVTISCSWEHRIHSTTSSRSPRTLMLRCCPAWTVTLFII